MTLACCSSLAQCGVACAEPQVGFRANLDVVLPPNQRLKNGPRLHRCRGVALRDRHGSPWRRLESWAGRPFVATWAGVASRHLGFRNGRRAYESGGMGSGPHVRRWLRHLADSNATGPGVHITDSSSAEHLRRNARELPRRLLKAPAAIEGQRGFGLIAASEAGVVGIAPYGGNNGWEGRSAEAPRRGRVPLHIKPAGSVLPLEPFVPHARFSLFLEDRQLVSTGPARLAAMLANLTLARLNAMRCEMACAAAHFSWGSAAPASCAGSPPHATGVVPTLLTILTNRLLPPARRVRPPPCPCDASPETWHYFGELTSVK